MGSNRDHDCGEICPKETQIENWRKLNDLRSAWAVVKLDSDSSFKVHVAGSNILVIRT